MATLPNYRLAVDLLLASEQGCSLLKSFRNWSLVPTAEQLKDTRKCITVCTQYVQWCCSITNTRKSYDILQCLLSMHYKFMSSRLEGIARSRIESESYIMHVRALEIGLSPMQYRAMFMAKESIEVDEVFNSIFF